jgi:hypothetical protein
MVQQPKPRGSQSDCVLQEAYWWTENDPQVSTEISEWLSYVFFEEYDLTQDLSTLTVPTAFVDWIKESASRFIGIGDINVEEEGSETDPSNLLVQGFLYFMGSVIATRFRETGLERSLVTQGAEQFSVSPDNEGELIPAPWEDADINYVEPAND